MNMIIDSLVVWRLTHLLQAEDGPYDIIFNMKKRLKVGGFWFELTKCFLCLSVWIGMGVSLLRVGFHLYLIPYGLALSSAAILLQLISGDH